MSSTLEIANESGEDRKKKDDDCDCNGANGESAAIACVLISALGVLAVLFGLCPCFKWKSRLVLMWFWLTGLSLTIGLLLHLHFYGPLDSPIGDSDQLLVKEKFNSQICSKLKVTSDKPVDLYLVDSIPNFKSNRSTNTFKYRTRRIGEEPDFISLGFYLTQGTRFIVDVVKIDYIDANHVCKLIKGRGGAEFDGGKELAEKKPWNTGRLFTYNVTESDYYYTSFSTSIIMYYSTPMDLRYTIERAVFDLPSLPTSKNATEAKFDLDYGKDYAYIATYNSPNAAERINIRSTCTPRLAIYLPCLFVLPLLIGLTISAVVHRKYGRNE